ncbi:hypothetical protein LOD99_1464 [Oopsacas minuta]|uniref:Uncharacterized protein n=1 Tax=Oopsacas minuta TaxID=111878 RepID=A0AAV7K5D7_9METZ|nr:hypothetical protein LOD99_1464 [Oopsacas minuta]
MFGCEAGVGPTSLSLPSEVINTLEGDYNLAAIVGDSPTASTDKLTTPVTITSVQPCDTSITSSNSTILSLKKTLGTGNEFEEVISNQTPLQIIEKNTTQVMLNRENAHTAQVFHAEMMVKRSRLKLQAGIVEDNVVVLIPTLDRGRGDARDILGVITHRDLNTDQYTIGV